MVAFGGPPPNVHLARIEKIAARCVRASPTAGAFLDGLNVASLALMAAITAQLGRAAPVDLSTALLALMSASLLLRFKVNATDWWWGGVLFPALHDIVSASGYDALSDEFEKRERRTFGHDGFEAAVRKVAAIEKSLGIEDLASFTPRT